jgi:hypothetical protein
MKKWFLLLTTLTVLTVSTVSVSATTANNAEKGKSAGKHNFEQWQTIKRLEVVNH